MKSAAKTVDEYVKGLPEDRRKAISALRKVILDNLPEGYQECMSYGMIGYVVPHSIYPKGYQCNPKLPLPFVNLGSQKNHMALYFMSIYGSAPLREWFEDAYKKSGKTLDMGKACVRFKTLEDLPEPEYRERIRATWTDVCETGIPAHHVREIYTGTPQRPILDLALLFAAATARTDRESP